jgi:hypothetical protein
MSSIAWNAVGGAAPKPGSQPSQQPQQMQMPPQQMQMPPQQMQMSHAQPHYQGAPMPGMPHHSPMPTQAPTPAPAPAASVNPFDLF